MNTPHIKNASVVTVRRPAMLTMTGQRIANNVGVAVPRDEASTDGMDASALSVRRLATKLIHGAVASVASARRLATKRTHGTAASVPSVRRHETKLTRGTAASARCAEKRAMRIMLGMAASAGNVTRSATNSRAVHVQTVARKSTICPAAIAGDAERRSTRGKKTSVDGATCRAAIEIDMSNAATAGVRLFASCPRRASPCIGCQNARREWWHTGARSAGCSFAPHVSASRALRQESSCSDRSVPYAAV
jgi:hypothetical protein